ncbi:MAG: hypothetical protein QM730_19235 [Anaerolineales bacterium]
MKQKLFVVGMMMLLIISCNLPSLATPTQQPAITFVPVATNTVDTGGVVTLNNVSFGLPLGVAQDALTEMVSATTDPNATAPWDLAPEHSKFTLTGYQVKDKFTEPQIFVYPAEEYAKLNSTAAEQIQRLKSILSGTPLTANTTPRVPFYNAAQVFAAHMQMVEFKTGRGVRFLTQYAQYPAPINNHEMFYHFQGLTNDGKYYVIAILPVTSSILAEDEKPESTVPAGGVAIPPDTGPNQAYYDAVVKALDAMYPDSFNPSLFQLDALIQSITITP